LYQELREALLIETTETN